MNQGTHKLTPLAILAVFVLTIPGLILGQLIAFVYGWFVGAMADGSLFNWISGGWFKTIIIAIVPNVISGIVGGYFGIRVTFSIRPLKQANSEICAYAIAAIAVALTAFSIFISINQNGMSVRIIEAISNCVGLVGGLFLGHQSIYDARKKLVPA